MSDSDKRGFSGFSGLLSDIDPEEILRDVPTDLFPEIEPKSSNQNQKSQKNEKFFTPRIKWLFGAIAVFIIIGVMADEKNSSRYIHRSQNTYESSEYKAPRHQTLDESLPYVPSVPSVPEPVKEPALIPEKVPVQSAAADPVVNSGASFDCSKAKSTLEVLICSDNRLSNLDGQVGNLYSRARESAYDNQPLKDDLLNQQREFLKSRLEFCEIPTSITMDEYQTLKVINCLIEQYNQRVKTLQNYLAIDRYYEETSEISPEIKSSIYAGTQKFIDVYQDSGLAGVKIYIDSCYSDAPSSENVLVYCLTFDSVASGVIPAIEKDNNYPLTPEFEYSVYQARVRKRLSSVGIADPYEQANVIAVIEYVAKKALVEIFNEQKQADK